MQDVRCPDAAEQYMPERLNLVLTEYESTRANRRAGRPRAAPISIHSMVRLIATQASTLQTLSLRNI